MEVQCHKKLSAAKGTAWMAGLAIVNHAHDIPTDLRAEFLETREFRFGHEAKVLAKIVENVLASKDSAFGFQIFMLGHQYG